jgi:transcriptional regulator with GAF, ATPase, and Fis domain
MMEPRSSDPIPFDDAASNAADLSHVGLIGRSAAFRTATHLIQRLAKSNLAVLVRGETGTGKELAARAIHYLGARRDFPFIPINCGAIPDMLVESELFGHVRGAFTDARETQPGLVAQADQGTLFLDEVDALSIRAQIALLRFLQDGCFRPIGARSSAQSRARVIAATNAELEERVRCGAFRRDLYFRLSVVPLHLPPLREREGDLRLLADAFLRDLVNQNVGGPRRIGADSLRRLERYDWPGNVRELANVIQRAFLLAEGDSLTLADDALGPTESRTGPPDASEPCVTGSYSRARKQVLAEFERRFVSRALAESGGNVSLAAKRAGKERRSFGRLLKKHGITRSDYATT